MIAATEKGKNDLSKEQVNCMYKYTISDILFDLMGDEGVDMFFKKKKS